MFSQRARRSIALVVHCQWAKVLLEGFDLVENQRHLRTRTSETGKGGAEAHGHFHYHPTCDRGDHHRTRQGQGAYQLHF